MALIRAFNNVKIGLKLPLISTLIVVASITAMGWNAYQRSNESLLERAHLGLQSVAEYQASMLTTLLLAVDRNLRIEAASPFTVDSLKKFAIAYDRFEDPTAELQRIYIDENPNPAGSRDELVIAPENSPFALMHSRFHPSFRATLKEFGYYDIFLFDTAGNLVYSVFKGADFATNFLDGQWRDTNLAQAYASAMEAGPNDRAIFADFARYGPSADAPAAFLARPVFDESGTRIGVMAFQLPSSLLNSTLANPIGLGETGDAYVFGNDGFYRSDTLQTEEDDTLVAQVDIGDMFNGLQDQEGIVEFLDASGQPVLAYVQPVNGLGQTWFLIAQQKLHEVLAPSAALKSSFLLLGSLTVSVGAAFSLLLSRSISAPLDRLGAAMADVAARNFETDVRDSARGDEIGEMGRKLEAFRDELSNAEREGRLVAFQSTAFQGSSSPMMTVDAEYKINFMNAAMEELLESMKTDLEAAGGGAQSEELVGQSFEVFACIAPEKIKGLMSEASLPRSIIYRIGDRTIEITGANVEDGAGTRIGAVYEWKDRSADIRNSSIIDAVDKTQSLVEFAPDGQILSANSTFCALIGLPPQELVGGNAKRLITFDQKNQPDQCDAWDSAARGDTVFGRFSLETEQAQVLEGSLNPILDETAETDRLVLIANDITEAQREKKRAEATQAAMQASQQKVVDALRQGLKDLSNGVLTTAITTEFELEYEGLRSDYNATLKQLSSAISAIIETTEKIHGEITEINSAASDLSGRTENQAATLEETAAAVDELSASVSSAADGASKAAEIVNEAKSNAEESGKVVQEAVAAMSEIQASSTEISKIIKVIDDIAFQTNLLALNAGVEAARAGDAGRGFAVVASEVRALAQRSSDAAREINGLISESGAQVKRGVDIVGATGTALAQIVASVTDIASHVNSIAASATEQAGGLKEINTAMNQLDQVTQQNTAMFEETSAASQALMREAQGLTKTVSQFDIGRPIAQGDQPASAPQERVMDIRGANQNAGSKPTFQPQAHGSVHASPKTPAGNTAIAVDPDEEWEDF